MIPSRITDSDMIILESVESYLRRIGAPMNQSPQEKIIVSQQARDFLYSDIVQRLPRVAAYLLQADLETDTVAQGLNMSLSRHVMDPVFINLLMQYLAKVNNGEENCAVGAYLTKLLNKWMEQNIKEPEKPKKGEKGEKVEAPTTTGADPLEPVAHIKWAIDQLLGNIMKMVSAKCGNLTDNQALAIAACIAMNNNDTIKEIIASDLPITADVLDVVRDPRNLLRSALLLSQNDIPAKPSTNQSAFLDSLKRWVYRRLNQVPTQQIYSFMVSTYGNSSGIDVSTLFINPKSCGNQFSNLHGVAVQMINSK